MALFALIEAGRVVNVVVADSAPEGSVRVDALTPRPGPGWKYDGQAFTPAEAGDRRVTKLAFRQRIGADNLANLELASIDNPAGTAAQRKQAASLRVMLADVQAATYIDLARADTRAGVQQLEAGGLLPPGSAAQILDAPIADVERPRE